MTFLSLSATVSFPSSALAAFLVLVTFGSPGVLVWSQRYKKSVPAPLSIATTHGKSSQIRGPWDPAVPQLR
jgi:hypothetical protein